jgi:hypothetical protein
MGNGNARKERNGSGESHISNDFNECNESDDMQNGNGCLREYTTVVSVGWRERRERHVYICMGFAGPLDRVEFDLINDHP